MTHGMSMLTDAAHLGAAYAAFVLGETYYKGTRGLPKDMARAKEWYAKVASSKYKHLKAQDIEHAARRARER